MNYYLNAFNEMLRKRQMQNQMMGGGNQDFGQGREYASPSGPQALGIGPARGPEGQYRSDFRDTMREMPPALGFALGRIPGIGTAFTLAKVADYAMGKASEARNAPANQQMSEARQAFRTSEIADRNSAMQNTPQQAFRTSELSGMNAPMQNTPQQAFQTGEKSYGPVAPPPDNFFASLFGPSVSLGPPAPIEERSSYTPAALAEVQEAADRAAQAEANFAGSAGMGNFGGGSNSFGEGQYNQGGMVNAQHLTGRAPAPDDGYGALQGGEYVITKAAVERYGKAMMDAINNGTFR